MSIMSFDLKNLLSQDEQALPFCHFIPELNVDFSRSPVSLGEVSSDVNRSIG